MGPEESSCVFTSTCVARRPARLPHPSLMRCGVRIPASTSTWLAQWAGKAVMHADTDWGVKSKLVGQAGKDGAMLGRIDCCGCPCRVHADTSTHGGGMSEVVGHVDIAECVSVKQRDGRVVFHVDIAGPTAGCTCAAAAHVDSLTPKIPARSAEENTLSIPTLDVCAWVHLSPRPAPSWPRSVPSH
jgi:hypothetical protein